MGMSRRLVWMPPSAARLTRIGSISATVPVLLTNAPMPAVTSMVSTSRRNSLLPASFMILPPIILARPVRKMAPPTTKSPTIITTMEWKSRKRLFRAQNPEHNQAEQGTQRDKIRTNPPLDK